MRSLLFPPVVTGRGAFGLLVLRVVVGAAFVLHGWGKVQNPMHWMDQPDAPSPIHGAMQAAAAFSEVGGGALLALGLLTPLACLALAGTMVGALAIAHIPAGHSFVATKPGEHSFELAAAYLSAAVLFFCVGPGAVSADALLFGRDSDGSRS
jgi:putative oxidoreductase